MVKRFESIPSELRRRRAKVVHDVNLDELLSSTIASQYSRTNIIAYFIELMLEEYVFVKEIEIFADVMNFSLEYPSKLQDGEFVREQYAAVDRLEKEFRERFCNDPPDGKIEWRKLADFLDEAIKST